MTGKPVFYSVWLAVFLSGAFLRFHALDRQSLWDDEMSTLQMISLDFKGAIRHLETVDAHPPLYFMQARLWRRAAGGALSRLRANSALWGALSLPVFYALALSLGFSSWEALLAMALLAFSPFHLAYSQELRPYAFAIFLVIAEFLVLQKIVSGRKGWGWWLTCFFLLSCELYTHYWAAFAACAQGVYGLGRFHGRRRRLWLGVCAGAALLFLFWLPVLRAQAARGVTVFWAYAPSPMNLVRTFMAFSGAYFRFASSDFHLPGPPLLAWAAAVFCAAGLTLGFRRVPRAVVLWLSLGLGLPFLLSYKVPALYLWYRYTSLMYPAFLLWVVAGWGPLRPVWLGRAGLGLFIAVGAWGCHYYFIGWEKANPKAVVAYVDSQVTANSVVIRPAYFSSLFSYYDTRSASVFDQHLQDNAESRRRFRGRDVILVAFDVPSDPIADAFRSEFKTVASRHFSGFAHLGVTVYSLK